MFSARFFQSCLIFTSEAGAYLSVLSITNYNCLKIWPWTNTLAYSSPCLGVPEDFRLTRKKLPRKNTLAYFESASVTKMQNKLDCFSLQDKPLQPSLIISSKARAYLSGVPYRLGARPYLQDRLSCKGWEGAPWACTIKPFTIVIVTVS